MPKVKIPRKSTAQDMTAMCDVAFLLLTFFMLTSKFTSKEVVQVATPSSISEIKIPDVNMVTILIDKDGKVYFGMDKQENRKEVIQQLSDYKKIKFTEKEIYNFSLIPNFGVPFDKLKLFLNQPAEKRDLKEWAIGIPCDSANNEFKQWIYYARTVNRNVRIAIKADRGTPYKVIKKIMTSLQEIKENRYNLITSLEEAPQGL